jgi:hypothetical protein
MRTETIEAMNSGVQHARLEAAQRARTYREAEERFLEMRQQRIESEAFEKGRRQGMADEREDAKTQIENSRWAHLTCGAAFGASAVALVGLLWGAAA